MIHFRCQFLFIGGGEISLSLAVRMLTKRCENTFYVNQMEPRTLKSMKEEQAAVSEHLLQSSPQPPFCPVQRAVLRSTP